MKASHGLAILLLSILAGVLARQHEINQYNERVSTTSSMICDVIQLRAQGGSTRDVHDQIFSFLRKRSPDPRASVVIRNGGKEMGSQLSAAGSDLIDFNCAIENAPDYQVKMSFHKLGILSLDLIEWIFGFFILTLVAFLVSRSVFKIVASIWSREIIVTLREDLGLSLPMDSSPSTAIGFMTRKIGLWMSGRLGSLKMEIQTLKDEIALKNQSLQQSEDVVITQNQILERAKLFEEKVRMVKHDLKSPLSSMKFAVFNQSGESEVLPEIISTVERILDDLENPGASAQIEANKNVSPQILEVIAKRAVEQKRIELGKSSKITIDFQYEGDALSPVNVRPDYLNRVFANLLQNAIEAIGDKSGEIAVMISHEDGLVKIEIKDSGGGIPAEIQDKLFSQGASFGKATGTGLGLFFGKSCLLAWGGDISAASSSDGGSVFTLRMPLIERLKPLFVGPQIIRSTGEIVLIDDEAEELGKMWNLPRTTSFTTPQQFIEWWESDGNISKQPLVVDLNVSPYISGLDILREIGLREATYLSTSDFMEQEVLETVAGLGAKIIPKQLI
jgi:signal transduction histidine kinase